MEARQEGNEKSPRKVNKLVKMPENSNESVAGTPSKAKVECSKWVVQLKGEYTKRKVDADSLVVHIVNENADPYLRST